MEVRYDEEADAVYVVLSDEPSVSTLQFGPDRMIDYTASSQPKGLEVLNVSCGIRLAGLPIDAARVAAALQGVGLTVVEQIHTTGALSTAGTLNLASGQGQAFSSVPRSLRPSPIPAGPSTNVRQLEDFEFQSQGLSAAGHH
jgi:uncharacterized protein YuzE